MTAASGKSREPKKALGRGKLAWFRGLSERLITESAAAVSPIDTIAAFHELQETASMIYLLFVRDGDH